MHPALIINEAWLAEESTTLQHLVVGLLDEGVRVTQVVPDSMPEGEGTAFGERRTWHEYRWRLVNDWLLVRLAPALDELDVDVIHAVHSGIWSGAAQLAAKLDAAVIFTAACRDDLASIDRIAAATPPERGVFTATTQPLLEAIREHCPPPWRVVLTPPGVHKLSESHPVRKPRDPQEPLCVVVSGDGRLDAGYDALLRGAARIVRDHPQTLLFFDALEEQHEIWRLAQTLGLLANLSLVPHDREAREALLNCHAVLHPQAMSRSRSLTLQAFAHGVPVIAVDDPWLDYLIPDVTCRIVDDTSGEGWAAQLQWLIDEPGAADALGTSAAAWVGEHRLASAAIDAVLGVYQDAAAAPIPFTPEASRR